MTLREGLDFFQSRASDATNKVRFPNLKEDGYTYMMLVHDEAYLVYDWDVNHDHGDEDDGMQKICERIMRDVREGKPLTDWIKFK